MNVVCLNLEDHFLNMDSKPMCIHVRCLTCQKEIYVCEICHTKGVRECEGCASEQLLYTIKQTVPA
ncbi:MAG: hypothetical protein AB7K24_17435 [Gemmataceae bacterium]